MRTRLVITAVTAMTLQAQQIPVTGVETLTVFLGATELCASEPSMTILVYDYVGIDGETLRGAEGEADHVFQRAGIEVGWRRCFPAANLPGTGCPDVGPSTPALRLVPRFQFVSGIRPDMMGYSTVVMMTVSLEEAEKAARLGAVPVSQILGLIIAHEFGHLLLGPAHSPGGIMRARWGVDDWALARQGTLFFLPRQAANLRKELLGRSQTAVAEGSVR